MSEEEDKIRERHLAAVSNRFSTHGDRPHWYVMYRLVGMSVIGSNKLQQQQHKPSLFDMIVSSNFDSSNSWKGRLTEIMETCGWLN